MGVVNSEPVSGTDIMRIKILCKVRSSLPDIGQGSKWLFLSLLPFVPWYQVPANMWCISFSSPHLAWPSRWSDTP